MELLGDVGPVESHFNPFGNSVSVGARLVHGLRQTCHWLRIILDVAEGTPWSRGSSGSSFRSVWRLC
jgi:hypothetical protein